LAKALSSIKDERYSCCFLAKLIYTRYGEEPAQTARAERVVKNAHLDKIRVCSYDAQGDVCGALCVSILFSGRRTERTPVALPDGAKKWRRFTKEEIFAFSRDVADVNTIHLTQRPIVQGMLLFKEFCRDFGDRTLTMKFIASAYAEEQLYFTAAARQAAIYTDARKICTIEM